MPTLSLYLFPMAASQSLPSFRHSLRRRLHHPNVSSTPLPSTSLYLKPTPTAATTGTANTAAIATSSLSAAAAGSFPLSTDTASAISFDELDRLLAAKNLRQADEETRRLLIALAGEAAQKRGYVYFSEVQFIAADDLKAIDDLWQKYSDGKFGYSVQKRIFEKMNGDFTKLFKKLGWMKKLDTEIEQYNYRAFPTEFIWELTEETPEGHLPLTNALRGTQLMSKILSHPAFGDAIEGEIEEKREEKVAEDAIGGLKKGLKSMSDRLFKRDYSF
ncbi:tetrapyrrole-binding protein, chloroplastic-like [Cucurbita moschata]|uniref:Tetrapyrrole-binding protein, chloroplastic-like n=1 Tax=Cucurbita moschata TaxID=3662 RepID=A0A6J1H968_CUCMO|nr:tetrapyrrole-binding protein, chloroplastic-like [Cucurbita moschata]